MLYKALQSLPWTCQDCQERESVHASLSKDIAGLFKAKAGKAKQSKAKQ